MQVYNSDTKPTKTNMRKRIEKELMMLTGVSSDITYMYFLLMKDYLVSTYKQETFVEDKHEDAVASLDDWFNNL